MITPADAARLLTLAAAFDRRTIGESDAIAWADVLADLDPQDCAEAVRAHYQASTEWIMPAHVRAGAKRIRNGRVRDPEPVPDADPDDVPAYLAALREGRVRQADATERPRPVRELITSNERTTS